MSRPVKRAFGHRFSRPLVQYSQVPSVHPSHGTPTRSPTFSAALARAARLDGADDLVAEDPRRRGDLDLAVEQVQVGAADRAGVDADQQLARARLGDRHLGRAQRLTR